MVTNNNINPLTKRGRLTRKTLDKLHEEMLKDRRKGLMEARTRAPTTQQQAEKKLWASFKVSNEQEGSGCCGIIPVYRFGWLIPHKKQGTTLTDYKTFRQEIKKFFFYLNLLDGGYNSSGKVVMVTLNHHQAVEHPHLLDILEYCGFEKALSFRNSSTFNVVHTFLRVQDKATERMDAANDLKRRNKSFRLMCERAKTR